MNIDLGDTTAAAPRREVVRSGPVPSGRYLARIDKAFSETNQRGNHELNAALTVKDAAGAKFKIWLRIVYKREDGSRVLAGCRQAQTLAEAARLPDPINFDTRALAGRYVAVTLDYESRQPYPARNVLVAAEPVELSAAGHPIFQHAAPAPTAGLPAGYAGGGPDADPMTGQPISGDAELAKRFEEP